MRCWKARVSPPAFIEMATTEGSIAGGGVLLFFWLTHRLLPGLIVAGFLALFAPLATAADWRVSQPGWTYVFPQDHGPHPEFKTEWWYFTGNLSDAGGRRFGYQLTLFRQGLRPPAERLSGASRFVIGDVKFGHFALSDVASQRFTFQEKLSRGAFGEAGFGADGRLAWLEDWSIELAADGQFHLRAQNDQKSIDLILTSVKPWAVHGVDGISRKAAGDGHASHYYSGTRMRSEGRVMVDGQGFAVHGESWFDHEWATNQLAPGQSGWNWFSLLLDDGSELMIYQMRLSNGGIDAASSGSFIAPDGRVQHLKGSDFELQPMTVWTSSRSGAKYPVSWQIRVPSLGLDLETSTPLRDQELVVGPGAYWEGLVDAKGMRKERPVAAHGYMELTGYAGPLQGLSK